MLVQMENNEKKEKVDNIYVLLQNTWSKSRIGARLSNAIFLQTELFSLIKRLIDVLTYSCIYFSLYKNWSIYLLTYLRIL